MCQRINGLKKVAGRRLKSACLAENRVFNRVFNRGYSQLIWVTAIGFFVFGDFPDAWSLLGIGILVASGIYIASHQRGVERLKGD